MDSGVSRIQQWREQKKKETQEKRRAHYEKNREKIIKKGLEAQWRSQQSQERMRMAFEKQNAPVKELVKKIRRKRKQQKTSTELKERLEDKRKLARERSRQYRQKLKDQTQAEAAVAIEEADKTPILTEWQRNMLLDD